MPKNHPNDLVWIHNVDTDPESFITNETVKKFHKVTDEETGESHNEYEDVIEQWDHKRGFLFKFNGHPHIIAPGAKKIVTREIGEHFATKLSEYLRTKEMQKQHKLGITTFRLPDKEGLLKKIIIKVQSYYLEADPIVTIESEEELLNEFDDAPVEQEEIEIETPETTEVYESPQIDVTKPKGKGLADEDNLPSTEDLMKECIAMGIEVTGTENKHELVKKLKAFA